MFETPREEAEMCMTPPPLLEREDWAIEDNDDGPPDLHNENQFSDDQDDTVSILEREDNYSHQNDDDFTSESADNDSDESYVCEEDLRTRRRVPLYVEPTQNTVSDADRRPPPPPEVQVVLDQLHLDAEDYEQLLKDMKGENSSDDSDDSDESKKVNHSDDLEGNKQSIKTPKEVVVKQETNDEAREGKSEESICSEESLDSDDYDKPDSDDSDVDVARSSSDWPKKQAVVSTYDAEKIAEFIQRRPTQMTDEQKQTLKITTETFSNVNPYTFQDLFTCFICEDIVQSNVLLDCGDVFCASCLTGNETRCPKCKEIIVSAKSDPMVDSYIKLLKVDSLRKKKVEAFVANPFDVSRIPEKNPLKFLPRELRLIRPPFSYFEICEQDRNQTYVPVDLKPTGDSTDEDDDEDDNDDDDENKTDSDDESDQTINNRRTKMSALLRMSNLKAEVDNDTLPSDNLESDTSFNEVSRRPTVLRRKRRRAPIVNYDERDFSSRSPSPIYKEPKIEGEEQENGEEIVKLLSESLAKEGYPVIMRSRIIDLGFSAPHHNMHLILKEETRIGHLMEYIKHYYHREHNISKEDMVVSVLPANWARYTEDVVVRTNKGIRPTNQCRVSISAHPVKPSILHALWYVEQYRQHINLAPEEVIHFFYDICVRTKKRQSGNNGRTKR